MKKISFLAAILAVVLVGTSAFTHKTIDPVWALVSDDHSGNIVIYSIDGVAEGPDGVYQCLGEGTCKITVTSGTPVLISGNEYSLNGGDYTKESDGTFTLN